MKSKNNLKKMKRKDLLEILLLQNEKIRQLTDELKVLKGKLEEKEIIISKSGSIAEASLKLNKVFEAAEKAADDYLKNIKKMDKQSSKRQKAEYNKKVVIKKEIINSKECL